MRIPQRPPHQPLVPPGRIDHHVRDMTATFAADVTLEAAQARLSGEQQWLPIDGDPRATLGQLVQDNSTGPLRLGYGGWRDLLLGCQFTTGGGELITAGGRTVKNVAGYDLTKFMVGQYGIFGRVVTLTTRTYRRPEAALAATFEPDVRRLNALLTTPARPQWCVLTADALVCGYLGDEPTIAFLEFEIPRHDPSSIKRRTLDEDTAERARLWAGSDFRAAVPPASIAAFVEQARPTAWVADATFGIVIGTCGRADHERVSSAARSAGGSVLLFDESSSPLKLPGGAAVTALLERLKYAFDPDGRLAAQPHETA